MNYLLAVSSFIAGTSCSLTSARSASSQDLCTFTVLHKQLCSDTLGDKESYIQINNIYNPDGSTAIHVRGQRAPWSRNSYERLGKPFSINGFEDGNKLEILVDEKNDALKFKYGAISWASDNNSLFPERKWLEQATTVEEANKAECLSGDWSIDGWNCDAGAVTNPRDRILKCWFPCTPHGNSDSLELL